MCRGDEMRRFCRFTLIQLLLPLVVSLPLGAHPHFRKTVTAKLPGLEITIEYVTYPWNPSHLAEVKEGFVFHCGGANLKLSAPAKLGSREIAAGKYLLRARAKDLDHWTFLLVPVPAERDTQPDLTKAIELETRTLTGRPAQEHLYLDLQPGHGETDGKGVLVLAWGDRQLEGILADFSAPAQ